MSTVRQAMKELLSEQPLSSLELSQLLSQSEKQVLDHLSHLARAPGPGRRFQIIPRGVQKLRLYLSQTGPPHPPQPLPAVPAPVHHPPALRLGERLT
jgi:hypothetical protein